MSNKETVKMPDFSRVDAENEDGELPVLVELKGDLKLVHALSNHSIIGRSPECSVWIVDWLLSRRHAQILRVEQAAWLIADLDSKLGTFVNRQPIQNDPLTPGDEIFVGSTLLRFELRPAGDPRIRRQQNRLRCILPVAVTIDGKTVQTVATDISLGGVRVEWGSSPGLGKEMQLGIRFPHLAEPLRLGAHANHKSDPMGLGVRFYFTSDDDEQALAQAYSQLYLQQSEQPST